MSVDETRLALALAAEAGREVSEGSLCREGLFLKKFVDNGYQELPHVESEHFFVAYFNSHFSTNFLKSCRICLKFFLM